MSASDKRSSKDTQDKDLMLDKDMEKDTWNFKSMTDDDPMDFGFDSPAKNKKNTFNLDMGFDLDGDFGNLSSFKMDMPDFDFSSPAKKTTKTKESSGDKSSGNSKQKKNPFAFSYDFDGLDDFDLGSSPPKKGSKTTTKGMDCEEKSATKKIDKSDTLDFGLDLPISRLAVSKAYTDVQEKASAEKENQSSKTTDTMVADSSTHSDQATSRSMENFEAVESPQGPRIKTSRTHTMCVQPQSVNTSPLKTSGSINEEIDVPCPSNEPAAPSSETAQTAVNRETSPDIHEICRSGTNEDCSRDPEQNANYKMISNMESGYEKTEQTEPDISSQLSSDKIDHQQEERGTHTQAEIQDHTRRPLCDPDSGHSQTSLSGRISPGTRPGQTAQVQALGAKLPLASSHSVPGLNNLKAMKNIDFGLLRSRFFKKPEKPESHLLESSLIQTEIQPVTREKIGSSLNPTNDRRHDIKDAIPGSKTRTCPIEPVNTDSEKKEATVTTSSGSREKIIHKDHSNGKTVENVAGQMDHLKLQPKNTTRENSILQINISSKLDASSSTQKLSRHLSSGAESLQKSKMVPLERPKLRTIMPLRAVRTQRTIGVNKDQSSSAVQPEVSSSISKERNTEAPVKKSFEIHHVAPRDKTQLLHCPSSLKRKALDEDADRSLKPQHKRFSISPRENRDAEELAHSFTQGKFLSQESRIDNYTPREHVKESPQTKSHHQIINMANLEIPMTENVDNIEEAEAYTKELENICNILKKKHEEAKELLVRAVINNNKLLMLNHPLYEDKIRMVQKFAAKLTLRDT